MESFAFADDLGPSKVIEIHEPRSRLRAILVVDNVAAGPAIGGTRMAPDVSLAECARLARAMTLKNAAAGLPHGGAKSVIFADPAMPAQEKEAVIRAFARAIGQIRDYIPGPDMGTNERCMAWVTDEIGRAVGLPRALGGIPLDEIGATGFGLAIACEAAESLGLMRLDGARVAIQGYGAVGRHAARYLVERGARIVAVGDSRGAVHAPAGLDRAALDQAKAAGRSVAEAEAGAAIAPEELIAVDCDIWIPAARPDVITEANVDRLRAKAVVQGANIPATRAAERRLHERGALVIPDFIANAGGVICAAVEHHGGSETAAFESIEEKIRRNTTLVLDHARAEGLEPRRAAEIFARERVETAMSFRR